MGFSYQLTAAGILGFGKIQVSVNHRPYQCRGVLTRKGDRHIK